MGCFVRSAFSMRQILIGIICISGIISYEVRAQESSGDDISSITSFTSDSTVSASTIPATTKSTTQSPTVPTTRSTNGPVDMVESSTVFTVTNTQTTTQSTTSPTIGSIERSSTAADSSSTSRTTTEPTTSSTTGSTEHSSTAADSSSTSRTTTEPTTSPTTGSSSNPAHSSSTISAIKSTTLSTTSSTTGSNLGISTPASKGGREKAASKESEGSNGVQSMVVAGLCLAVLILLILALNGIIFFHTKLSVCSSRSGVFDVLQMSPVKKERVVEDDVEANYQEHAGVEINDNQPTSLPKETAGDQAVEPNGDVHVKVDIESKPGSSDHKDDDRDAEKPGENGEVEGVNEPNDTSKQDEGKKVNAGATECDVVIVEGASET